MKISVIIPTYNGAHKIINVLRSLEIQTLQPDEVIVVIDGSTDKTNEILQAEQFTLAKFQIIDQKNGGRANVRNNGAKKSSGDLLVFLDDDMIASPECIFHHKQHHNIHKKSILTGGLKEPIGSLRNDFSGFKSWLNKKWSLALLDLNNSAMTNDNFFLTAGNCSMPRDVFDQLNGFDERLNDAEDYDMATRAMLLKIPLYFGEDAWAYHNELVNCRQYIKRLRQYSEVQTYLSLIKPELYGSDHKYKVTRPTGNKAFIFKRLCSNFWITSVDKNSWKWLPKPIRYKLYDLIVTANGSFYPDRVRL